MIVTIKYFKKSKSYSPSNSLFTFILFIFYYMCESFQKIKFGFIKTSELLFKTNNLKTKNENEIEKIYLKYICNEH